LGKIDDFDKLSKRIAAPEIFWDAISLAGMATSKPNLERI
jgi:hypothetical protein